MEGIMDSWRGLTWGRNRPWGVLKVIGLDYEGINSNSGEMKVEGPFREAETEHLQGTCWRF